MFVIFIYEVKLNFLEYQVDAFLQQEMPIGGKTHILLEILDIKLN